MILDQARAAAKPLPARVPVRTPIGLDTSSIEGDAPRALVISGSYGAGHNAAAYEIRDRILQTGWHVDVLDIADLYPLGIGHLLRRAYFKQLQIAPSTWRTLLRALDISNGRSSSAGRRACGLSGRLPAKRVAEAVRPQTRLVVSTHPFASQALGFLRERDLLQVPAVTYLTDASVHPLWISQSVDVHIAVHEEAARQANRLGAAEVRVIEPLTPEVPHAQGHERAALRSALGLGPAAPIALISSGSEGAGDVRRAARDVRETGAAVPVVLCGHNERLRRKLDRESGVAAVGWLEGLTEAIRGADCLIQNSGGFTTLEALALGTPLISYRPLPGHGEASADALRREGLAPWPQTVSELSDSINDAVTGRAAPTTRQWARRASLLEALPMGQSVELAS